MNEDTNSNVPSLVSLLEYCPVVILADMIRAQDTRLFHVLPCLCRRMRECFTLSYRLDIAIAMGASVHIRNDTYDSPQSIIEWRDGDGFTHSLFGPARIYADGSLTWYQHGLIHRDGDLPAMAQVRSIAWYRRGRLHRSVSSAKDAYRVDIYRPARVEWKYGRYVRCSVYVHGRQLSTHEWSMASNSDSEVDQFVDMLAGVPWREWV